MVCCRWRGHTHLYEGRDDCLHCFVDDLETVGIIQAHDVGTHEGEDRHNVVKDFFL